MRNRLAKSAVVLALVSAMLGCGGGGDEKDPSNGNPPPDDSNGNPPPDGTDLSNLIEEMADSVPAHRDMIMRKASAEPLGRSAMVLLQRLSKREVQDVVPLIAESVGWHSIKINDVIVPRSVLLNADAVKGMALESNDVEVLRLSNDIKKEVGFMLHAAPKTAQYLDLQNQEWFGDPPGILTFELSDSATVRDALADEPEFDDWWERGTGDFKSALKEGLPIDVFIQESKLMSRGDTLGFFYSSLSPNTCSALDKALRFEGMGYCREEAVYLLPGFQADLAPQLAENVRLLAEYIVSNPEILDRVFPDYWDEALPSRLVTRDRDHFAHEWKNDLGIGINDVKIDVEDDGYEIVMTHLPAEACIKATEAFVDQGIYHRIVVNFKSLAGRTPGEACNVYPSHGHSVGNIIQVVGYLGDEVIAGSAE